MASFSKNGSTNRKFHLDTMEIHPWDVNAYQSTLVYIKWELTCCIKDVEFDVRKATEWNRSSFLIVISSWFQYSDYPNDSSKWKLGTYWCSICLNSDLGTTWREWRMIHKDILQWWVDSMERVQRDGLLSIRFPKHF